MVLVKMIDDNHPFSIRQFVERYGGKVWVEDRVPGQSEEGAAFKFTLKKATKNS